ncbi:MAG: alcohol dehydrogenase catalytic domain-containing protein [Proteobacteria bacterium]|nr:alcohol dehydrogenase catalytic domain-containing protein [Pseudomonadota bacterium]
MKTLLLEAPRTLTWADVCDPELEPSGALVRPLAVGTCDFDHLMVGGHMPFAGPLPIGHEFVAEIVAVGESVRDHAPSDRVIVPFQINCGTCSHCKMGRTSSCRAVTWLSCYGLGKAAGGWGGAVSDLVSVPHADAMLVPLPAGLRPDQATSLSCNIPDAHRCVAPQLARTPEAPVLIAGGSFENITLYATAIARSLGASEIDILGAHPSMRDKLESCGGRVLDSGRDVKRDHYPVVVDASRNPELLNLCIDAVAPAGELTISSMYLAPTTPIPMMRLFEKCIAIKTGQPDARAAIDEVLPLLLEKTTALGTAVDEIVPWHDAARAFSAGVGKVVVVRDEPN